MKTRATLVVTNSIRIKISGFTCTQIKGTLIQVHFMPKVYTSP